MCRIYAVVLIMFSVFSFSEIVYGASYESFSSIFNGAHTFINNDTLHSLEPVGLHVNSIDSAHSIYKVLVFILFPIILILSGALVALGLLYRKSGKVLQAAHLELRKIKRAHLKEVEGYKDRELSVRILELEKRKTLIKKIKTRLLRLKENFAGNNQSLLTTSISEMERLEEGDIWTQFEANFIEAHPRFMKKLKAHFPDLTENEVKICALIRINLTSKEISEISDLSIKSIETVRTRLRKKFNLSNSDAYLSDFLRDFN